MSLMVLRDPCERVVGRRMGSWTTDWEPLLYFLSVPALLFILLHALNVVFHVHRVFIALLLSYVNNYS